jgi:hypothetical protein
VASSLIGESSCISTEIVEVRSFFVDDFAGVCVLRLLRELAGVRTLDLGCGRPPNFSK